MWGKFLEFWQAAPVPVIVVRFEDLIKHPEVVLSQTLCFLLQVTAEELHERGWTNHINRAITEVLRGRGSGSTYKPRRGTSGGGLSHFTKEQREVVVQNARVFMDMFGYHYDDKEEALGLTDPRTWQIGGTGTEMKINSRQGPDLRHEHDPYGRKFCRFRKALPQPVISISGECLNVEEVERSSSFPVDPFIKDLQDMTGAALHMTLQEAMAMDSRDAS